MPTCFLYSWWRPDFLLPYMRLYWFQISKRLSLFHFIPLTSSLSFLLLSRHFLFGFFLTASFFLSACALWRQAYNQTDIRYDSKFGVLLGNLVRVHFARLCSDVMIRSWPYRQNSFLCFCIIIITVEIKYCPHGSGTRDTLYDFSTYWGA